MAVREGDVGGGADARDQVHAILQDLVRQAYDLEKRQLRTRVNRGKDYLGSASSPRFTRDYVRLSHYERA